MKNLKTYKAFNRDLTCRGFQFKMGESYTHKGVVKTCNSGFHACENPLDMFRYYAPSESVFAQVTQSGKIDRHDEDSKIASSKITIKANIAIADIVKIGIEYIRNKAKPTDLKHSDGYRSASSATGYSSASSATGDRSASSATGDRSASSATGYSSASSATGYRSASSATGYSSASSATGDSSASSATGDRSASSATGYSSASSATGYRSASSATGDRSASSATGYSSASSATGYRSASSATGYRSASSATGYRSASSATGDSSASSATGDRSASSATGDSSASSATGYRSASLSVGNYGTATITKGSKEAVAIGIGYNNKVRAPKGNWIVLAERNDEGIIKCIKSVQVDGKTIKADTWYGLENGEFVVQEA